MYLIKIGSYKIIPYVGLRYRRGVPSKTVRFNMENIENQ